MMLIKCENLSFEYEGRQVLSDLSFDVSEGDFLCIVGENGSGKSTLVKALLGLKKPQRGSIEFGDRLKPTQIGYLPQRTEAQSDFPASVREVVLSGCRGKLPFRTKAEKDRCAANMELMGVDGLARRSFRELSGGQQQRVLLARALCGTERLLLLDEPTAGLDPLVTRELYSVIDRLHDEGITIIMVTHDIGVALENATHMLHLHEGHNFFGPTGDYLECDDCRRFLGGEHHHD
ncbi:MAG: metal ABC transporter ATP-binding protein [Clostridia bacterium]|nr:metal ABC transporter ATP-binding protein [Clostridia bacterium]